LLFRHILNVWFSALADKCAKVKSEVSKVEIDVSKVAFDVSKVEFEASKVECEVSIVISSSSTHHQLLTLNGAWESLAISHYGGLDMGCCQVSIGLGNLYTPWLS